MSKKKASPSQYRGLKPFKKGESGNPAGRPKGSKNTKTVIDELLNRILTEKELMEFLKGHRRYRDREAALLFLNVWKESGQQMTFRQAMALAQTIKAMRGDTQAFSALLDRVDGKPTFTVNQNTQSYIEYLDGIPLEDE